jgi:WD40 repeat protein
LTYSPDGVWLAFADGKGPARVWNTQTGKALQITSSSRQAKFLSFLPDSSGIMVWFEDKAQGAALEFRSLRAEVAKSLPVEIRDATILRSLTQGRVAVGNREGVLTLIDLEHAITHANAGPAGSAVVGLEVSPDGKTLLVNRVFPSGDGYCTLADADYGHDILELTVDSRSVLAAAFLAKGRGVVMVGDDLKFHAWHLPPENSAAPASN